MKSQFRCFLTVFGDLEALSGLDFDGNVSIELTLERRSF